MRGRLFILTFLPAILSALLVALLNPPSTPINTRWLILFLVYSVVGSVLASFYQYRSEERRSRQIKQAIPTIRDARSKAFELKDDVFVYARVIKSYPNLFTFNQIRSFRKLSQLLNDRLSRLEDLLNDLKELHKDTGNIFAPFDADFKDIQQEYRDIVDKLRDINNLLNPIRNIVDSIENLSVDDLMPSFDASDDISGLIDIQLDSTQQTLSDEE